MKTGGKRQAHTKYQDVEIHEIPRGKWKHSHDHTETQVYTDRTFDRKGPETEPRNKGPYRNIKSKICEF